MKALLTYRLNSEEISKLGYQVVVESWHECFSGRTRRAWLDEFNEKERKYLSGMYSRFYKWYLVTKPPQTFTFSNINNLAIIQRAANFFATI